MLAVGGILNDGAGMWAGHVRVYQAQNGHWEQIGSDIDGEASVDMSGWMVSLSADGKSLAVGAPRNDGNGADSGHVRVYQSVGNEWQQIGPDLDGEAAGDRYGYSVSLN